LDNHTLETVQFIHQRDSGEPGSKVKSIEEPARTVTQTGGNQELVSADFMQVYHGNGSNVHSVDGVAPTIPCKDSVALVQPQQYIVRDFTQGGNLNDINTAAGTVMTNPKMNLVTPEAFVMKGQFGTGAEQSKSLNEPLGTVTASRHAYYLMNPQWGNANASSIDKPANTLIARMDKAPPYLIATAQGEMAIAIQEGDTEHMINIKEFMAMYGIIDIYMRMLFIDELKSIQGFPKDYVLLGNQAEQKKFLGNAVEVNQAKVILQASAHANFPHLKTQAA
jgi:DNA (cytosine-5)-methyltransferase 1